MKSNLEARRKSFDEMPYPVSNARGSKQDQKGRTWHRPGSNKK